MRKVIEPQMQIGELAIGAIKLDPKSRDDIPQLLRGLQHIYTTPELRGRGQSGQRGRTCFIALVIFGGNYHSLIRTQSSFFFRVGGSSRICSPIVHSGFSWDGVIVAEIFL